MAIYIFNSLILPRLTSPPLLSLCLKPLFIRVYRLFFIWELCVRIMLAYNVFSSSLYLCLPIYVYVSIVLFSYF